MSFQAFAITELRKVFGEPRLGPDATGGLLNISQGNRTVQDYAIDFRTKARLSDWNEPARCDAFLRGLGEYLKDELVSYELPSSFDDLVGLTTRMRIDGRRIQARRQERRQAQRHQPSSFRSWPAPSATEEAPSNSHTREPEPMHIGRTRLSPEEHARRRQGNLCLYCGQAGHFISRCPAKGTDSPVEGEVMAISASALDGHLLGTVTHQTEPIHMLLSGNHHETIQFHILHSPRLPLILGYPWLRRHNPHVDWLTGAILGWGSSCHQVCLRQAVVPESSRCFSTPPDLTGVPTEYLDFREVFNKAKATSLPPHRPYDCAIDLQPGTTPPLRPPVLPVGP
ncbi:hypothetical protein L3Q82_010834 [Scortum barcoo]|uniref:Uncharacterized protein n=1 Tax=Scortum barcoo TaxID=214431 RepID=A0ACB8W9B3_9TELE|nr:hypothetical protein L3Q82_010834 [Scortum barcoo]